MGIEYSHFILKDFSKGHKKVFPSFVCLLENLVSQFCFYTKFHMQFGLYRLRPAQIHRGKTGVDLSRPTWRQQQSECNLAEGPCRIHLETKSTA